MSLNLEKQMTFVRNSKLAGSQELTREQYGSYHHNSVNVGIHVLCVPAIAMTFLVLFTNTPEIPLPSWLSIPNLPLNLGTALATLYSTLYILMEPVAGALLAPLVIGWTAYAKHLTSTVGAPVNYWAAGVNVVSWIAQFVGHGKFEGRAPALLDNLVQALFLAPFFVWFEILFFLGYRPELKRRINTAVEQELQKLNAQKGKGANGATTGLE
ncbi:DUF962-domain-containing protein [Lophiostoma macrostomum CBS 122681]|uniref:DUF962-domain-containing protein n=1 Tax=Lophiostoma macrostomum CBS 122681 TaxID=1314788 RepID=A0A6A6TSK6_9PLEO|nr:DUF962-domain-containing protein [Lophiostoma macrostomum CBS 122681]